MFPAGWANVRPMEVVALQDLLTSRAAARELGVSETQLRRLVRARRLPYVRTPWGRGFVRADVEAVARARGARAARSA